MTFNKYTKYCSQQILVKCLNSQQKTEQEIHILLNVFKKSLNWLAQQNRQMFVDAISRLSIRKGASMDQKEEIIFIYVIKGIFWYHQMAFKISQYTKIVKFDHNYLKYEDQSIYAVLTASDIKYLVSRNQMRQKQMIRKFIKRNIFYPSYIQDEFVTEFAYLTRTTKLNLNKTLKWKDQDHSHKIGLVYKGVLSIQYNWKRKIQICQITKGMLITNMYIKDMLEQIAVSEREKIDEPINTHIIDYYSKLKYVSKADNTIVLIFNLRLINEPPFNVNPELKISIKKQYEKYIQSLSKIIEFEQSQKFHRSKRSIKSQLKRRKAKQSVQRDLSLIIKEKDITTSPILQTYTTIELEKSHPYSTINFDILDIPTPSKQYSKVAFTSIPLNLGPKARSNPTLARSKTTQTIQQNFNKSIINKRLIHNTWFQSSMNNKKTTTKSFSNLTTLSIHQSQKQKFRKDLAVEESKPKEPQFFVPDQFVKRKLKLKYENLISKMKNFDLSLKNNGSQTIFDKMARLQEYIDSKRIVKMNMIKTKHKLLRDRVTY